MEALISVIVPTFNNQNTIKNCLESIVNQSYNNVEAIVVDTGSFDETIRIAKKFAKVCELGEERSKARNFGVDKSKGDFLLFVDSDMELSPNLIEDCVIKCTSHNYDALIIPEIAIGNNFWSECRKLEKKTFIGIEEMEFANRFMKREVFFGVGGYDTNLIAAEDYDLHHRIVNAGYRIGRAEEVIKHNEDIPLLTILRKKYYYGKTLHRYVRKHPTSSLKEFCPIKKSYIINYKLFIKDPIHTFGLIFMKFLVYFVGLLGVLRSLLPGGENR